MIIFKYLIDLVIKNLISTSTRNKNLRNYCFEYNIKISVVSNFSFRNL